MYYTVILLVITQVAVIFVSIYGFFQAWMRIDELSNKVVICNDFYNIEKNEIQERYRDDLSRVRIHMEAESKRHLDSMVEDFDERLLKLEHPNPHKEISADLNKVMKKRERDASIDIKDLEKECDSWSIALLIQNHKNTIKNLEELQAKAKKLGI